MNNKLLLVSIVSVVILILVSFTSVIGYRSIEPYVKVSPLFNIRSSKAIGKENKDFTCNYLGKGEESVLSIPKRDDRNTQIQKMIEVIYGMEERTFNTFIWFVIKHLKKDNKITDKNALGIITALHQLRSNIEHINEGQESNIVSEPTSDVYITICKWLPGCWLENILFELFLIPLKILLGIFLFFYLIIPTIQWTCGEDCIIPS